MGSRSESDELFRTTLYWVQLGLVIALNVISVAFILSVWLTKWLLQVVNHLTEGELDRNELLGVLISAVIFGGAALLLLPALADSSVPLEQTIGGLLVLGMVWGTVVGWKVMLDWWHELEMRELPEVHYSRRLNLPAQHYLHT